MEKLRVLALYGNQFSALRSWESGPPSRALNAVILFRAAKAKAAHCSGTDDALAASGGFRLKSHQRLLLVCTYAASSIPSLKGTLLGVFCEQYNGNPIMALPLLPEGRFPGKIRRNGRSVPGERPFFPGSASRRSFWMLIIAHRAGRRGPLGSLGARRARRRSGGLALRRRSLGGTSAATAAGGATAFQ